jgi:hypothetical protein
MTGNPAINISIAAMIEIDLIKACRAIQFTSLADSSALQTDRGLIPDLRGMQV